MCHFLLALTLSWRRSLSYKNKPIDLQSKWVDRFLYGRDLHMNELRYLDFDNFRLIPLPCFA